MAASDRPGNASLLTGALNAGRNDNLPIGAIKSRSADLPIGGLKPAIQENGAPRWHSRGYLPHFESPHFIQHVTFHLADSLPRALLSRLAEELKFLPDSEQDAERRRRLDACMDEGYGSCILRVPAVGSAVEQTLLFFDGERYRLFAWGRDAEPRACSLSANQWVDGCKDRGLLEEIYRAHNP